MYNLHERENLFNVWKEKISRLYFYGRVGATNCLKSKSVSHKLVSSLLDVTYKLEEERLMWRPFILQ
jgi:hypothetical protein